MANDREGVTVHTMNTVHQSGPVFYASLPCEPRDTETIKGLGRNREEAKHLLVSTLWDHLVAMEHPLWNRCHSSNRAAFHIQVVSGPLGRPHLMVGEYRGPAISFSESGGKIWAALCGDESDIGIDVAGPNEFKRELHKEYPFHRVFHSKELQHALSLADGNLEKASALLWSVKEAVVKALGSAFHLVDPRQITVYPSAEGGEEGAAVGKISGDGGYTFSVGLSGKALVRFPIVSGRTLSVRSLPQRKMWLSIALLNRRPTGNE